MAEKHRRSIRLHDFDYTSHGAYFITIVTQERRPLFGRIEDDRMLLTQVGRAVEEEWRRTADLRDNIEIDEFVVMPNHIHGIFFLLQEDGASSESAAFQKIVPGSVPAVVRAFKAATTRRLRQELRAPELVVWQRNYFERNVRSERHLNIIRQYIEDNPLRWALDRENP